MTATERWDAVVVGAGPAGSTIAALLARRGFRTLLLDRERFPREKACADYIAPGGRTVLGHLGLLDQVAGLAAPIAGMEITGPGGVTMRGRFRDAGGFGLPRREFDHLLVARARHWGVDLWDGATVERVLRRGTRVAGVVVRDARHQRCHVEGRLIVGADGLRSVVARAMGGGRRVGERRIALVAHIAQVAGLHGAGEMFVTGRGYAGLAPLPGAASVAVVLPAPLFPRAVPVDEVFWQEIARLPQLHARVGGRPVVRAVMATGPFGWRSRRLVTDGALLVGDAASFFDPFTGDGLTAALTGSALAAEVAGRALERGEPVTAAALRPYTVARRRAFRGRWIAQRTVGAALRRPRVFDRTLAVLSRRDGLADQVVRIAGGLDRPASLWGSLARCAQGR